MHVTIPNRPPYCIVEDDALIAIHHNQIFNDPIIASHRQGCIKGKDRDPSNGGSLGRVRRSNFDWVVGRRIFAGVKVTSKGIARGVENNVVPGKGRFEGIPKVLGGEAIPLYGIGCCYREEDQNQEEELVYHGGFMNACPLRFSLECIAS